MIYSVTGEENQNNTSSSRVEANLGGLIMAEKSGEMVTLVIGGVEVQVAKGENAGLLGKLDAVVATQQEEEFAEVRNEYLDTVVDAANDAVTDENREAVEGMCILIPLDESVVLVKDGESGPILVDVRKVTVKQRLMKPRSTNSDS